ncbi:hypothetical protein BV25DRAFT_1842712 [Artomyces pyxidatus]|uniref:Uncharacterized protein n=1 Tax=Artomyces pyxidatus TaxID=48021 RepID=A0ACB8SHW1_9AGAM|nr:hypothetical protein BV25DRAFT_1842712 [Artomyces pyxidatus]
MRRRKGAMAIAVDESSASKEEGAASPPAKALTLTRWQKAAITRQANKEKAAAKEAVEDATRTMDSQRAEHVNHAGKQSARPSRTAAKKGAQEVNVANNDTKMRKRAASSTEPVHSKGAQKPKKQKSDLVHKAAGTTSTAMKWKTVADDDMDVDNEATDKVFEIIEPPLKYARKKRVNGCTGENDGLGSGSEFNVEEEEAEEPEYSEEEPEGNERFDNDDDNNMSGVPVARKTSKALARQFEQAMQAQMPKWKVPTSTSGADDADAPAPVPLRKRAAQDVQQRAMDDAKGSSDALERGRVTCHNRNSIPSSRVNVPESTGTNK